MQRGDIWWASLTMLGGSGPGFRRPILVIQSNEFNRSRINTVIAVAITSNLMLANAPGNVRIPARASGLKKASVDGTRTTQHIDHNRIKSAEEGNECNGHLLCRPENN